MLRTRTDLFRIALLASFGVTACGSKSTDGNTTTSDPSANGPGAAGSGGSAGASSQQNATAGQNNVPGQNNTTPNIGAGGAQALLDAGPPTTTPDTPIFDAGVVISSCNPVPVPAGALAQCDNGVIHRPQPTQCPNNLAAPDAPICGVGDAACFDTTECASNADCTAQPYGHCTFPQGGQAPVYQCAYGCLSDSDCGADQVCICGAEIGACMSATCSSDSDCGAGLLCAGYYDRFGIGCGEPMQFACQTPNDECAVDEDCPGGYGCNAVTGARVCTAIPGVACGRPFFVDHIARLAPAIASSDFMTDAIGLPAVEQLSAAQREVLADAWTEIARMEHASIAAFARFNLQLLSLGAPCSLVEECNQAIADETRHARLAFSLASHYAAQPIGPGALSIDGALGAIKLAEVLELVIVEGCIGETVAALEAAEAMAHCRDRAVRDVLRQIHQDETRHAALAWRFVAWALEQDPSLAPSAAKHFAVHAGARATSATPPPACNTVPLDTLPHGILTAALRSQVRQAALQDVVLPCAAQLGRIATSRSTLAEQPMIAC